MENPIKIDDLGGTTICGNTQLMENQTTAHLLVGIQVVPLALVKVRCPSSLVTLASHGTNAMETAPRKSVEHFGGSIVSTAFHTLANSQHLLCAKSTFIDLIS